jgi:hypothetical protein
VTWTTLTDGLLGGVVGTVGAFVASYILVVGQKRESRNERNRQALREAMATVSAVHNRVLKALDAGGEATRLMLELYSGGSSLMVMLPRLQPASQEAFELIVEANARLFDALDDDLDDREILAATAVSFCQSLRTVQAQLGPISNIHELS